jgi:hypothetical protein
MWDINIHCSCYLHLIGISTLLTVLAETFGLLQMEFATGCRPAFMPALRPISVTWLANELEPIMCRLTPPSQGVVTL